MFKNREEAARLLAEKLIPYKGRNPLVLAVPRGAVPMGRVIADALDGELDVVLVHKLGAPHDPEFAIGSVSESGDIYLTENAKALRIDRDYIRGEATAQLNALRRRRDFYTPVHRPVDPGGRVVIVVDNGIATGATLIAALRAVREKHPARLIAAAAVAPRDSLERLKREADETVCLESPEDLLSVGQFYSDFTQVTDEDVIALLNRGVKPPPKSTAPAHGLGRV